MTNPTSQADQLRPAGRTCAKHQLQAAPDGKCALCRREERAAAEPTSSGAIGALFLIGAIISLAVGVYMYKTHEPAPPPVHGGPTPEEELKKIEEQLRLLRAAKRSGDISPQERTALEMLESRRRVLTRK